jgi:hypothetical protein
MAKQFHVGKSFSIREIPYYTIDAQATWKLPEIMPILKLERPILAVIFSMPQALKSEVYIIWPLRMTKIVINMSNALYPIFLKLENLSLLIIGGGKVALEKLESVLVILLKPL